MSVYVLAEKTYKELFYNLYIRAKGLLILRKSTPEQIEDLVNELYMINIDAYNTCYEDESAEIEVLRFKTEGRKWQDAALFKILECIRYNTVESEIKLPLLFSKLMIEIATDIIKILPEYKAARWGGD